MKHDNEKQGNLFKGDSSHGPEITLQTPVQTAFNVIKTIVGAGIFCTAYGFHLSGFYFGMFLVIIMAFIFHWTIMTFIHASVRSETENVQDLLRYCFGVPGVVVLNISLLILEIGVFIADTFPASIQQLLKDQIADSDVLRVFLSRRVLITIISGVILFPVSMIRDMAGLSKFSGVAMAAVLVIAVSMTAVAPTLDDEFKGDISKPLTIINPEGIAGAINIFSFAYVCHQNLIINYHEMKNKTIKTFEKVSIVCLVLSAILTILMGSTYISFREKSDMNILNSFPLDNMVIIVCKILFAFDMMMSFPVGLYVVRDTIEHSFFIGKKFSYLRHTLVTIFLTVLCIGIACATCDLGVIIGTTGGLASVTIAFILPSACWLQIHRLQKQNLSIFSKVSHVLCIFFGVVLLGLTIYDFALGIINPSETKDCKWDGI